MKKKFVSLMAMLSFLVLTIPMAAQANFIDFNFFRITDNDNLVNPASQFDAKVYDSAQALSEQGQTLESNEVLFVFRNDVGIKSNISEVYFDDGTILSQTRLVNSLGGFTDFGTTLNPADLPSGNTTTPPFIATVFFGADASGNPANGIDAAVDALGIVIALQTDKGWADLLAAIADGSLRLGLHVRSIGDVGGSDSFVSLPGEGAPVPEPATMLLLGSGLIGLAGFGRRKFFKK